LNQQDSRVAERLFNLPQPGFFYLILWRGSWMKKTMLFIASGILALTQSGNIYNASDLGHQYPNKM
jgi:hypothetical protein